MKKILIIIAIAVIIIAGGWVLFFNQGDQSISEKETEISTQSQKEEVVKEKAFLIIDNGEEDLKNFEIEFYQGMTAFDLLKKGTEESDLTLKAKDYPDMGIFIEAIGDKENGEDEKYWMYYVNGEMPMVSADNQEIKAGDKVEFKFEKSSF